MARVARWAGQVSILGDLPKPPGNGPGQPALSSPAWQGGLDKMSSRAPFQALGLYHSRQGASPPSQTALGGAQSGRSLGTQEVPRVPDVHCQAAHCQAGRKPQRTLWCHWRGPDLIGPRQPQVPFQRLWSRAPPRAQLVSSLRTVDLHLQYSFCVEPQLAGVLWVLRGGFAVAVSSTEDSQPAPPPSLTASSRYPVLARAVLVVRGEERGRGILD